MFVSKQNSVEIDVGGRSSGGMKSALATSAPPAHPIHVFSPVCPDFQTTEFFVSFLQRFVTFPVV